MPLPISLLRKKLVKSIKPLGVNLALPILKEAVKAQSRFSEPAVGGKDTGATADATGMLADALIAVGMPGFGMPEAGVG